MKTLKRIVAGLTLAVSALAPSGLVAQSYDVSEPKKIKSAKKLKEGEGALQVSLRTQVQYTQTLYVSFIKLNEDGTDSDIVYRMERGAGVPVMGSNMIDPKAVVYRLPAGLYRPLAYTVACRGIPSFGSVCSGPIAPDGGFPTAYYRSSGPVIDIKAGELTVGGDFIVEYDGPIAEGKHVGNTPKLPSQWNLRWRPLDAPIRKKLASLPVNVTPEPDERFRSRITCDARPEGVMLYIPHEC